MKLKFSVGEIAVVARNPSNPMLKVRKGDMVEIITVGPILACFPAPNGMADYRVRDTGGMEFAVMEYHLRKLPGDEDATDLHEWMDRHNLIPKHEGETA